MFGMGGTELLIVFVVILLVFGPSQIPKMAKGLGQAMREFRKAQNELTDEMRADETKTNRPPDETKTNRPPDETKTIRPPDDKPVT